MRVNFWIAASYLVMECVWEWQAIARHLEKHVTSFKVERLETEIGKWGRTDSPRLRSYTNYKIEIPREKPRAAHASSRMFYCQSRSKMEHQWNRFHWTALSYQLPWTAGQTLMVKFQILLVPTDNVFHETIYKFTLQLYMQYNKFSIISRNRWADV